MIGESLKVYFKCSQRRCLKVIDELRINLTDKYRVMNTTDCPLNSAQCERIDNYCICHCYPGYSIINGSCLKGKRCRTYVTGPYR